MARSVLDAIKEGLWNYEPAKVSEGEIEATVALPGTTEKLDVLAERLRMGLPLWHPSDRISYDEEEHR